LLGLGKVHAVLAVDASPTVRNAGEKAEAYFAAALSVDAGNWQAANELGVLLARQGRLAEAVTSLRHSTAIQPCGESLHNLAVALHYLGQGPQAKEAHEQAVALGYGRSASRRPDVQWVSPDAMTGTPRGAPAPSGSAARGDAASPSIEGKRVTSHTAATAPKVANHRAGQSRSQAASSGPIAADGRLNPAAREGTRAAPARPDGWQPAAMPGEGSDEDRADETAESAASPRDKRAEEPAAAKRGLFWWLPWN
jgi:hypothetical protein